MPQVLGRQKFLVCPWRLHPNAFGERKRRFCRKFTLNMHDNMN